MPEGYEPEQDPLLPGFLDAVRRRREYEERYGPVPTSTVEERLAWSSPDIGLLPDQKAKRDKVEAFFLHSQLEALKPLAGVTPITAIGQRIVEGDDVDEAIRTQYEGEVIADQKDQ